METRRAKVESKPGRLRARKEKEWPPATTVGKPGHFAKECWSKNVHRVEGGDGQEGARLS